MKALLRILTASLITSLGIAVPYLWFLVFPGLALFLFLLQTRTERMSSAATYGLIYGTVTAGAATIWFWDTLPLSFLGISNPTVQRIAVGMTWGYVAVSLGIPVLFAAVLLWFSRSSRWFSTIALVVWPITEIARMWSFAAFTWAPQSLFGPHFSAASIGYALAEHEYLLQLAHPLGIDALNLLVATIAVGSITLLSVLRQREQRAALAPPVIVALLVFTSPLVATSSSPSATGRSLRFAIISERIQDVRDFSHHPLVSQTIAEAAAAQPPVDVVLLPEEFSLTSIFWSKEESSRFLKHHFGERDVLILNTRNNLFPEDERNESRESKKLVYDSTTRGELGRYVKQMLMPLGEYAPAFTKTFFSLIPDPELHLYVDDVAAIPSADRSTNTAVFRGVTIGGLLCSDILSPHLYRTLARDHGAQILVNLSNHFWFHGSRTLFWKTLQMAKVHAVQNRAPLLLSNNMAPSFALDSHGRLLAESGWGERRVLVVDIPID